MSYYDFVGLAGDGKLLVKVINHVIVTYVIVTLRSNTKCITNVKKRHLLCYDIKNYVSPLKTEKIIDCYIYHSTKHDG